MNAFIRLLHILKLYTASKSIADFLTPFNPLYLRRKKAMRSFYANFLKRGDVCFDVGANIGNRSEIFLELGARVIAVEPQQACIGKLEKKFAGNRNFFIVPKALGESEGESELMISNASTISSLSKEWVESVKKSGRFKDYRWDTTETIPVTTFDSLIEEFGVPSFTKIDVEGFESSVMKGLSQPVGVISFEFTPEFMTSATDSIKHLVGIGDVRFNYSIGETMSLVLDEWVSGDEICSILGNLPDKNVFGDVYARFVKS